MDKHFITLVSMHIAIIALVGCIFTRLQLVKIPHTHMHADCKIAWMLTLIIRYMYVHGSPCWKPNTCLKLYCHWEWGHTHTSVSDIHVILWTTYTSLLNKKRPCIKSHCLITRPQQLPGMTGRWGSLLTLQRKQTCIVASQKQHV